MRLKQTLLALAVTLGLMAGVTAAEAQWFPAGRSLNHRSQTFILPLALHPRISAGKKPDVETTSGYIAGGFLLSQIVRDTAVHVTWTTSIAQPLYPTRLVAALADTSSTTGINCATVDIWGSDQGGLSQHETLTTVGVAKYTTGVTLDSTAKWTKYAYAHVDKIAAASCYNGSATQSAGNNNTNLLVAMSRYVALPVKIVATSDIKAACVLNHTVANTGWTQISFPRCSMQSALTALASTVISGAANTLDLEALHWGNENTVWPYGIMLQLYSSAY